MRRGGGGVEGRSTGNANWQPCFLASLIAVLAAVLFGASVSAAAAVEAETRVGAISRAAEHVVEPPQHKNAGQHPCPGLDQRQIVVATGVAAETGGAASVRLGQAGESAVRDAFDIGAEETRVINGRTRIFDGLNDEAVSEVKNVQNLSFTRQLRDYADYASEKGLRLDIYVRGGTNISGPLARADLDPASPVNRPGSDGGSGHLISTRALWPSWVA